MKKKRPSEVLIFHPGGGRAFTRKISLPGGKNRNSDIFIGESQIVTKNAHGDKQALCQTSNL